MALTIRNDNDYTPNEWERMLRIVTDNSCEELYVVVPSDMDDDEIEDEIRFSLRRRFGKTFGSKMYCGYEDVSWVFEQREAAARDAADAWEGEGYYVIGWSDGGEDWTSEGPVWFDTEEELAAEILCAYGDATDTHLPGAEKVAEEDVAED